MELRVLNYFLAVSREQSIIRAAESLHLSQPTLSTQLKDLEKELGTQLLIRGGNGTRKVTLTEEGMILKKRAEEILELVKKTEHEISLSDQVIVGDITIGTGETDAIRLLAKTAKSLYKSHPGIHYHIQSGNADYVFEQLDKGLIDFGLVFGSFDNNKYNSFEIPQKDTWGVLMRKDSELAQKQNITITDLFNIPLIIPQQQNHTGLLSKLLSEHENNLEIIGTYNLLFNASLMVQEGLGVAIGFDGIINTTGDSTICFRPLTPINEDSMHLIWKKYQILSKAATLYKNKIKEAIKQP